MQRGAGAPASARRKEKEREVVQAQREERNCLYLKWLSMEEIPGNLQNLLEPVSEFNKVTGYKANVHNVSCVSVYQQ